MIFKKKEENKEIEKLTLNEAKQMFDFNLNYIGLSVDSDQTVLKTSAQMISNHIKPNSLNRTISDEYLLNYKANNRSIGFNQSVAEFFDDRAITTFTNSEYFEDIEGIILLPPPRKIKASIYDCIMSRRSIRKFTKKTMSLRDLSTILKCAMGVSGETRLNNSKKTVKLRTNPSGGGLYPIRLFFALNNVESLKDGIYEYMPYLHGLKFIRDDYNVRSLAEFSFINIEDANLVFMYIYNIAKNSIKYGNQATTYALIEAGEIAQNIQLASTGLVYGACDIGGYEKELVEEILSIDGSIQHMIHMTIVGSGDIDEI